MSDFDYSTLTSKGQLTVPKRVREALALRAGDRVVFDQRPDGTVVLIPRNADIRTLKGVIKTGGRPVSLADMNAAIEQGTVERARR